MDAPLTSRVVEPAAHPTESVQAASFDLEYVTITRREYIELQRQARQYRSLHGRVVKRMQAMQAEQARTVAGLKAQQQALRGELERVRALTAPSTGTAPSVS